MEDLIRIVKDLKQVVSEINHKKKTELALKHKNLRYILFDRPRHYISLSEEVALFEKKFKTVLSDELKEAVNIVGTDGYPFLDLLNYNVSTVDVFFSEKFVKNLIDNGLTSLEIEDGYFDKYEQEFSSEEIKKVYLNSTDKTDLLIHCVPFNECCGGRSLLVLNGKDKNLITYDNHVSDAIFTYKEKTYRYVSYIKSKKDETILDMITDEVLNMKIKLEPHMNMPNKTV